MEELTQQDLQKFKELLDAQPIQLTHVIVDGRELFRVPNDLRTRKQGDEFCRCGYRVGYAAKDTDWREDYIWLDKTKSITE